MDFPNSGLLKQLFLPRLFNLKKKIVLVPINRYSWRFQLEEFSKDYHVIAIDQRGYAESDKPSNISDYHIEKMVADIRQFVKQLGKRL